MGSELFDVALGIGGVVAGVLAGFFVLQSKKVKSLEEYRSEAEKILNKAQTEAKDILEDERKRSESFVARMTEQQEKLKAQNEKIEKLILSKEEQLSLKGQKNADIQKVLQEENSLVQVLQQKNDHVDKDITLKLSERTGISLEQAKQEMLDYLDRDLELAVKDRLTKYEEFLQEDKERLAKNLITNVIQRYSAPTSVEKKDTKIKVERDEHKARIIGKNAENILLLEELTGVDIVFNDEPGIIIVSCFDLVRRYIARETILKLLKERIVTPDKIRYHLEEAKKETEKRLITIGRETVKMLGLNTRNFSDDFYKIVGRLKFRTSYGQNILKHSFEVGYFTLMLGSELYLDMTTCKVGGFFHDLGKAIDQEVGGSHDVLTKDIMEKHQCFSDDEIHAAWTHHDAIPQRTAEAMLVKAGDAISAGRPGARQESLEKYIERIQAIESIGMSYEGVNKTFAISAGRELRVLVEPKALDDQDLPELAKAIATEIQGNVAYPGKIKVNVIRRTKTMSIAK